MTWKPARHEGSWRRIIEKRLRPGIRRSRRTTPMPAPTAATADTLYDRDIDTMPRDRLQELQLRGMTDLLTRLREHDVWRDKLQGAPQEIRSVEDLSSVPLTLKEDLRAAQAEVSPDRPVGALQLAPTDELVQFTSSSGTTGAPTFFGLT